MTTILLVCFISETIMFLHQIFYQGLKARIASWPTLVLGKRDSITHLACFCCDFLNSHTIRSITKIQILKTFETYQ